ncbi:MAG: MFS transporter [Candidatus Kapaibacteriota bacterium]
MNESLNEPLNQDGWKRNLLVLWIAQFIAMIGMTGVIPFLPLYVRELGVSPDQTSLWSGFIIAAPFATAALLTPLWGSIGDRYGQKLMVMRAVAGLGLTVAAMGLATNVWVLFVLRILQGAVSGFIASTNAFVSSNTPSDRAGYALGTLQTSISAGAIVGPLVGGAISDAFGFQMVFFVVGGLCTLSLVTVYAGVREQPVDHPAAAVGCSRTWSTSVMTLR